MEHIIELISKNREWLFSGAGIIAITWILAIVSKLCHWPSSRKNQQKIANTAEDPSQNSQLRGAIAPSDQDASSSKPQYPSHAMVFYYESPHVPSLTEDEIRFLTIFSSLPRRSITRGYHLDYLYDLLKSKGIPPSTSYVFICNLYRKGYLMQHTTKRQTKYYALSDVAMEYLVAHRCVGIDYVLPNDREPPGADGRGLS
jgi:hypothetical protein